MQQPIYEILIRGNEQGGFNGGHVIYFGSPLPHALDVLSGGDVPEWLQSVGDLSAAIAEIEQLRSQIQSQAAEIAQLKTQAAPAICEILSALESAGLNEWAGAAITASPNNAVAVQAVVELRSIAAEPPNWSQCDRIKLLFGALIEMSGVVPSPEQARAMQQILDDGPDSTGPVSAESLNFHPFMG